ncbi:MAG: O-antigen translocase [Algibacter sp.]|uniref:O-antigen translocase n=1 Tax=Algibacter sp. TaxID=1872428 RepID=UPI0032974E80
MLNSFWNRVRANAIFKVASLNSLSLFVRLISGFAISKFMAVFIGPSGMALSGNLGNFFQSLQNLSSIGFKNGVIKYIAEFKEDEHRLKEAISSGFLISVLIGLLSCATLFLFGNSFSLLVFSTKEYSFLFKISAFTMPFFTVHVFFLAVMNGLKKVKDLVIVNVAAYMISAILIILLMGRNQLEGALLAIVLTPIALIFSLLFRLSMVKEIIQYISFFTYSKSFLLKITSFFSMTLVSAIMFPVIFILIRNYIISNVGTEEAGFWEGIRKISNYYMLFVYSMLEIYLLPLLAENKKGFKAIVFSFYKSLLPFVIFVFLLIFSLKVLIVKIVLTKAFLPMENLFLWQLIGDFFRIVFLTISYQFIAKKLIKMYILCEVVYMMLLYFISVYFIDLFGVIGAVKAHALTCFIYMLILFLVFRNEFFRKNVVE